MTETARRPLRPRPPSLAIAAALLASPMCSAPGTLSAQAPVEGEVRQVVTFSFLPGRSSAALSVFRDEAVPLYREDDAMLSFRGFREVESPVPLGLIVVSSFRGMAGMDASNAALRTLAERAGSSIGAIYGRISEHAAGHTDQFVRMLPDLGSGDPSSRRLTAFVSYRVAPGRGRDFEDAIRDEIVPLEEAAGIPAATGRFLVSDGWDYLRMVAFESLGAYQDYSERIGDHASLAALTVERREVIVSAVPALSVR